MSRSEELRNYKGDLSDLTVKELKAWLKDLSLTTSGDKAVLVQRLQQEQVKGKKKSSPRKLTVAKASNAVIGIGILGLRALGEEIITTILNSVGDEVNNVFEDNRSVIFSVGSFVKETDVAFVSFRGSRDQGLNLSATQFFTEKDFLGAVDTITVELFVKGKRDIAPLQSKTIDAVKSKYRDYLSDIYVTQFSIGKKLGFRYNLASVGTKKSPTVANASPVKDKKLQTKYKELYLVVLVTNMYYSPESYAELRKNPLYVAFRREGSSNVSGTHGVKVGLYSTLEKAMRAEEELREDGHNDENIEIIKFKVHHRVPPKTKLPSEEELTWGGKPVLEIGRESLVTAGRDTKLSKNSDEHAYLIVYPFEYHGVRDSRLMELLVVGNEDLAIKTRDAYVSKLGPDTRIGYMVLPIDESPKGKIFNYDQQEIHY